MRMKDISQEIVVDNYRGMRFHQAGYPLIGSGYENEFCKDFISKGMLWDKRGWERSQCILTSNN